MKKDGELASDCDEGSAFRWRPTLQAPTLQGRIRSMTENVMRTLHEQTAQLVVAVPIPQPKLI
jgi:hypothetical protein